MCTFMVFFLNSVNVTVPLFFVILLVLYFNRDKSFDDDSGITLFLGVFSFLFCRKFLNKVGGFFWLPFVFVTFTMVIQIFLSGIGVCQ